jgi:hypothetical protein
LTLRSFQVGSGPLSNPFRNPPFPSASKDLLPGDGLCKDGLQNVHDVENLRDLAAAYKAEAGKGGGHGRPHHGLLARVRQHLHQNGAQLLVHLQKENKNSGLQIRIHFIRIRIQHFWLNTNPDPGLQCPKNEKKLQLKKI